MLRAASVAVLIPGPDGEFAPELLEALPNAMRAPAPGPPGWNAAVLDLLRR
jgi:hypothetical protein